MVTDERRQDRDNEGADEGTALSADEARLRDEFFAGPRIATFEDYLEQLATIANSTRFVICYLLYEDGDTTYKELSDATDKVGNALNYHLDTLQTAGLITQSKQRVDSQERSIYSLSILGQKLIEPIIELIVEEGDLAEQYT